MPWLWSFDELRIKPDAEVIEVVMNMTSKKIKDTEIPTKNSNDTFVINNLLYALILRDVTERSIVMLKAIDHVARTVLELISVDDFEALKRAALQHYPAFTSMFEILKSSDHV